MHQMILETLKNHVTPFLPDNLFNVIDVTAKELGENAENLYKKDLFEAIGFQNGFKPWTDFRGLGLLGPILMIHLFERIDKIYSEAEFQHHKFEQDHICIRNNVIFNFISISQGSLNLIKYDGFPLILVLIQIINKSLNLIKH
jgi:hypothetical protein